MAVAGTTAMAQTQQTGQVQQKSQQPVKEKTLYVVDGKVVPKDAFEKLSPEEIKNISVLKGIEGAIVVSTKEGTYAHNDAASGPNVKEVKSVKVSDSDGKIMNYWAVDDPGLDTAKVKSVTTVSKDSDGEFRSEERKNDGSVVIRLRGVKKNGGDKDIPLIIVKNAKGEVSVAGSMDEIKPETIKAISVRKDSKVEEFRKYGNTTYGVIVIELL